MVQNKLKIRWIAVIALALVGILFLAPYGVSAQEVGAGLQELQQTSGLGNSSFITIVGKIIRVVLSILGVITLGVVIFGGFLWMTSSGSEENLDKAKKTIANGVIGLAITLSAFAITQFVMSSLSNATGTQTGFNTTNNAEDLGNIDSGFIGGGGASSYGGGLQVKSISPKGAQTFANLKVAVIFTGIIDESTVAANFKVTSGDDAIPGTVAIKGDTITFTPSTACAAPNESKKCFGAGKTYTISVTGGKGGIVSATTKKPLNCSGTSCSASFVAGDKVDVKAPVISNVDPKNNDKIPTDQIIPIQALLSDDNAISFGRVAINDVVLESVPAANLLQEFVLQSKKFTTKGDVANKIYKITLSAEDVAGNAVSVDYNVQTSPQHCFNKKIDGDEADIDCSAPGGACGLCTNVACKKDIDCAGGAKCDALKNSCVALPAIKSVQPQDGAPGTFVTLGGQGFGTQFGEVVFLGNPNDPADDAVANLACEGSWSDTQVVIQVPEEAVSGPIQLKNAAGSEDETDDADGLKLTTFAINDVQRPGLCSISPTAGLPGKTKVTLAGNDFLSDSALERKLFIGGYLIDKAEWSVAGKNTVTGDIPPFEPAKVYVQVTIKSIASNPLELIVEDPNIGVPAATISALELGKGPVGQYVTIKGSGFGTTPNKVYFVVVDAAGKLTSDQTPADINFPQQCAKTFWKDNQVIVKVPNIPVGTYAVVVQPFGKSKQSSYKLYTVTNEKLGPQVCALVSDAGPADGVIKVTMYGENFGKDAGAVIFNDKYVSKPVSGGLGWSQNAATVTVPTGVVTGSVKVVQAQQAIAGDTCAKAAATCSNPMQYTVLDCRAVKNSCQAGTMCCGDGSCQKDCAAPQSAKPVKGVFAWCFSTGDSCDVVQPPRVVEECGANIIPSPSPATLWPSTAQAGACGNSMLVVKFTQPVDPQSVVINNGSKSSVLVEECTNADDVSCVEVDDQPIELSGLQVKNKVDEKNAGFIAVPKNLKPSTRYKVTLSNSITGFDSGLPLSAPEKAKSGNDCKPSGDGVYCYIFKTSDKQGQCDVDSVGVAPSSYNAGSLGMIMDPLSVRSEYMLWAPIPVPADKCQVLDPSGYAWSWSPAKKLDTDFDFVESGNSLATFSTFIAKSPTAGKAPATVTVKELRSGKTGTGKISVDLGVPVIVEECSINGPRSPSPSSQWGGDVCAEATVVVEFNQPVVNKSATGSDGSLALKVWECNGTVAGKECDSVVKPDIVTGSVSYKFEGNRYVYGFQPTNTLAKNTNYLVEIPTTTKGVGEFGKQMAQKQGCRAGVAYCYTFKTAANDDSCKLTTVEVSPFSWKAVEYGVQQMYSADGDLVDQIWHSQGYGKNQCVWLKNKFNWSWYTDKDHQGFAAINPAPAEEGVALSLAGKYWSASPDQNVAAYKETKIGDPVQIIAAADGIEGKSFMDIAFPTPTILSYQPSACGGTGVCSASAPSVEFSVMMNVASLSEHAYLFECPAEKDDKNDCLFTSANIAGSQKLSASAVPPAVNAVNKKMVYVLSPGQKLKTNTRYRVVITEGVKSTAEKMFVGFNYPKEKSTYFSWTFSVTKDQCAAKTVKINPVNAVAQAEGEKRLFIASAYSEADSCYPEGQLLDPTKQYWAWGTSDPKVVRFDTATSTNKQSFVMEGKGVVDQKDSSQLAVVGASTGNATGSATWKLQCSSPPTACPQGTWAGADHCCHLPPKVSETYPKGNESGICRNTLMTFDVTDWVSVDSVSTSSVRVGFATNNRDECPTGTIEDDYCFDEVGYSLSTTNVTAKDGKRTARVTVNLNEILPANKKVLLKIRAVGGDNPKLVGLKSTMQVPVVGAEVVFTTGDNFCQLTDVAVFPSETTFTKLTDSQTMYSYGLSQQGRDLVPISSIPKVYSWSWNWFSNNQKIAKYKGASEATTTPDIIPGGFNGQTTVAALAVIKEDTIMRPATIGATVAGSANVDAALCELPWFPQNEPVLNDIIEKHHFDFWYCRVSGKSVLPKLIAVKDSLSEIGKDNFTTLDSFRLLNQESGGAIGIRVEKNLKQYSPLEWFYQKQFKGEPEAITIDGFNAVRSGNTVYIGFGNAAGSAQYTNILVVSLAEPASAEMQNIFNQLIDGMQFVRNVKDVGLCFAGSAPQNKMCTKNSDCNVAKSETCNVEQAKFRRDMIRIVDSSVMTRAIKNAKAIANSYPIIAKDSFIAGITSSRWPSWSSFMNQLGIVTLVDPINEYAACAGDADPATCWSVKAKKYQCGVSSSVYHYRTVESGKDYQLGIPLEQTPGQQNLWQGEWASTVKTKLDNNFCIDKPLVGAAVCGDGAIGVGEQCDPAGSNVSGEDLKLCSAYGKFVGKCSATCQIEQKQCVNLCGDGIVQAGVEACDDGAKYNGQYNHCGLNCQFDNKLGSCGNGVVEKNEVCDVGTAQGRVFLLARYNNGKFLNQGIRCVNSASGYELVEFDPATKTFIAPKQSFVPTPGELDICKSNDAIGMCEKYQMLSCDSIVNCPTDSKCVKPVVGTKYSKDQANSCNWNCKSLGSYCGDKVVNAADGEQCDGNTRGNQCTNFCTADCKWKTTVVGSSNTPVCEKDPDVVAGPMSGCGDGVVNPSSGEECDLGLDTPNCDPTKTSCKVGGQNGVACVPGYGQNNSCQYCTTSCKKGYVSGGFCGDGVVGGPEECDKVSFGQVCDPKAFDYHTLECAQSCTVKKDVGSCQSCAINTTKFTAANKSQPEALKSNANLIDPTLGWLPGYTGVNVAVYRGSSVTKTGKEEYEWAASPYPANSNVFAVIGNSVTSNALPVKSFGQIAFDAKDACFKDGRRYVLEFVNSAEDGMNAYESDKIGKGFGAFQYGVVNKSFLTADALQNAGTINVLPQGDEGDYRIVMRGTPNQPLSLKMSNKKGQINSVFDAANPSGYVVGITKIGLLGTCKTGNQSIKSVSTDFDLRIAYSGCISSPPYAEADWVSATIGADKNFIEETSRHILTIKKHNGSFYDGVYEISVTNWESAPLDKTNTIVVYKNVGGLWVKFYEIAPPTNPGTTWNAFTFVGNGAIKPGDYTKYNELDLGNVTTDKITVPSKNPGTNFVP